MAHLTESEIERAALEWLSRLGYAIKSGPGIAPDGPSAERQSYAQVVLELRLTEALQSLNPMVHPRPAARLSPVRKVLEPTVRKQPEPHPCGSGIPSFPGVRPPVLL